MRIGIITFHRAYNYGAILQTYALYSACLRLGADVEIIDYRCPELEGSYNAADFPRFRKNIFAWTKDFIGFCKYGKKKALKRERFNQLRHKMLLSQPYYVDSSKIEFEKKYDVIITGSDQVWSKGIVGNIKNWYCYNKTGKIKSFKVVAYAASVGSVKKFDSFFDDYKPILEKYDNISVREEDCKNYLCEKMDKKIDTTLDPTLLLDSDFWLNLADKAQTISEPYLLCYDVAENKVSESIALEIAKRCNLKIVRFNEKRISNDDYYFCSAGPTEFIAAINNADFIVTSSFHMTVFSIIFKRQFLTTEHSSTGSRVRSLLKKVNLLDRIVEKNEKNNYEHMIKKIDYDNVNEYLSIEKERSEEFLKNVLNV